MNNQYTIDEIKNAFWKTFHEQGEIFFSYLGDKDENLEDTEEYWEYFLGNLSGEVANEE